MKKFAYTIAGIPIKIHWTFWLLVIWIVFTNAQKGLDLQHIAWALLFTALIFVCVLLHELGHALMALRFGIRTRSIILLPIGGLANIEQIPESPKKELWITLMGPVVNALIAILLFPFVATGFSGTASLQELAVISGETILFNLFAANVFMVLFNLIPAFPMDGGRILRATLAYFRGWERATRIAVIVAGLFSFVFIAVGIFTLNFMLSVIGVFVWLASRSELNYSKNKSVLTRFKVKDVVITDYQLLLPMDAIQKAADLLLSTQNKSFVVMRYGKVAGIVTQKEIIRALTVNGPDASIIEFMNTNFSIIDEDESLDAAYQLLSSGHQAVLLVTSGGSFIGLLDIENIEELMLLYEKSNSKYNPTPGLEWSGTY